MNIGVRSILLVLLITVSLPGCKRAEVGGPVSDAEVTVAPLTESPTGLFNSEPVLTAQTRGIAGVLERTRRANWGELNNNQRMFWLGTFDLDVEALDRNARYIVRVGTGSDFDPDLDNIANDVPVTTGRGVVAIMTYEQLAAPANHVTPLSHALTLAVSTGFFGPADSVNGFMASLDQAAQLVVDDIDGDGAVDYADVLLWSRFLNLDNYIGQPAYLDALTDGLLTGRSDEDILCLSLLIATQAPEVIAATLPGICDFVLDIETGSQTLQISSELSTTAPFAMIELNLADIEGAPLSTDYIVEVDTTGSGQFSSTYTLQITGLVSESSVLFSIPYLGLISEVDDAVGESVKVRVRGSDGKLSNALSFTVTTPQSNGLGIASTLLELVIKATFAELDPLLTVEAERIFPGATFDALVTLGIDPGAYERQAEAILQALFGVSAADELQLSTNQAQGNRDRSPHYAAPTQVNPLLGEQAQEAFRVMLDCVSEQVIAFGASSSNAGRDCWDVARTQIRDEFIPGIASINSQVAAIGGSISRAANFGTRFFLGNYAERMARSATASNMASDFAQIALRTPGLATTDELVDYVEGRLTRFGASKLYGSLTESFDPLDQYVLEQVGAPDAAQAVVEFSAEQFAALHEFENQLFGLRSTAERLADEEEAYLADGPIEEPDDGSGSGPLPSVPGVPVPPGADFNDLDVVCSDPGFADFLTVYGFPTCESYFDPFRDQQFFDQVLSPLVDQLLAAVDQQLAVCGTDFSNFSDPACTAAAENLLASTNALFDSVRSYEGGTFACAAGYSSYPSTVESIETCIWSPLVYPSNGGSCFDGSRLSPYDTGGSAVCQYYSRDYYLADGSCRDNYTEVFFQGADRCRWSDLPASSPAAYSLETSSGDQQVLEP